MTDILIPDKRLNLVMDISQYDTFRTCEQKYYLRYIRNKHTAERAMPLDRGTLIHLACEIYYTELQKGTHYQDAVNKALFAVRSAGVIETDLSIEDILVVIDVMEEYFDFWRIADQGFQIVDVEKPFMYLLHESEDWRLYLSGKIDLVTNDNQHINLPTDHKSYSRSYPTGRMSNQFKNYVNALKSDFLQVNKIGLQKTLKPHEKYKRDMLTYDKTYLETWKNNVIMTMDNYIACLAANEWPMNETSCDKFNKQCEYYEVCDASGAAAKEYKLIQLYIDGEPWDVTKNMKKTSEAILELKESNK